MNVLLLGVGVLAFSGVPGLAGRREGWRGQLLSTILMFLGSALGLTSAVRGLMGGTPPPLNLDWSLPWGRFAVGLDPLGAAFLVPVFLVPALGCLFGQGYWRQADHPADGRKLRFFYGLLAAAMALVVLARDSVLFLIAWETMALAAYFLITTDDEDEAAGKAGWIYLIATHLGTLLLVAMFVLLRHATGSFSIEGVLAGVLSPSLANVVFLLALAGFGFKAGLMPLHVWLPGAHAAAPSHVSAILSGVMLKMGVYGLVRMTGLLPSPPSWWGATLLALGIVTAILGIAFALGQTHLKRALAYSSIENIGIIAAGLGLALMGRTMKRPDWFLLGLGGALLHAWNHAIFKPLLFMGAGSVAHAAHSLQTGRLGGLAHRMPRTAVLFAIGAVAISGLPPFNGFVGEFLIYLGLFRTWGIGSALPAGSNWPLAALAAPGLALVGALAVACFVNLLGTIFLGQSRSDEGRRAHDPGRAMILAMSILAGLCPLIGLLPGLLAPALDRACGAWTADSVLADWSLGRLVPWNGLGFAAGAALVLMALALSVTAWLLARRPAGSAGTWDCGYARPTARMQYSGSSFAQNLVGVLAWTLWPRRRRPDIAGAFAPPSTFTVAVPDVVLDRLALPAFGGAARYLPWIRILQQGRTQIYGLYFLGILLVLFLLG